MEILIYTFIFLYAISIGSFLNVVIYRLPIGENIAYGRSHCTSCNADIKAIDLIPILSFLNLRGKCRNCKSKISNQYILIELLTGVIAIGIAYKFGFTFYSVLVFLFALILIVISMIDLQSMIIPDRLNILIGILAIAFTFSSQDVSLVERAIGFFAISVPMYILVLFIEDGFGGGDIKFIAFAGLVLGYKNTILTMFVACILASIVSIYLLSLKKIDKKSHIPFGPYLCMASFIAIMCGDEVISWYLSFF